MSALAREPDAGLFSNRLVQMNAIVDRPRQAAEEAQRDQDLRHIRSPHKTPPLKIIGSEFIKLKRKNGQSHQLIGHSRGKTGNRANRSAIRLAKYRVNPVAEGADYPAGSITADIGPIDLGKRQSGP